MGARQSQAAPLLEGPKNTWVGRLWPWLWPWHAQKPPPEADIETQQQEDPAPQWCYVVAKRPPMRCKTILSVDGGGVRGLIPAAVLEGVEERIKRFIKKSIIANHSPIPDFEIYTVTLARDNSISIKQCDSAFYRQKLSNPLESDKWELRRLKWAFMKQVEVSDFHILLADYFDMFIGTSTGSIVATYLATRGSCSAKLLRDIYRQTNNEIPFPGSAAAAVALFKAKARVIFPEWWWPVAWADHLSRRLRQACASLYSQKPIHNVLSDALGNLTLQDGLTEGTSLVIVSFELEHTRPISFFSIFRDELHANERAQRVVGCAALAITEVANDILNQRLLPPPNQDAQTSLQSQTLSASTSNDLGIPMGFVEDTETGKVVYLADFVYGNFNVQLAEAVLASTAAPTFFPAAKVSLLNAGPLSQKTMTCIDGGVAANNPAQVALSFAAAAGFNESDLAMLSLGTGSALAATSATWSGAAWWIVKHNLLGLIMSANSALTSSQISFMAARGGSGGPYILRIDRTIFDSSRPGQRRDADVYALSHLDLSQEHHLNRYETIGRSLLGECNGWVTSPDPNHRRVTNQALLDEDFIRARMFRERR